MKKAELISLGAEFNKEKVLGLVPPIDTTVPGKDLIPLLLQAARCGQRDLR